MAKEGKIPSGVFGRTSKLLLSTAKIAGREVAGRLAGDSSRLATKIRQTEELVSTLSQLKGAAMKAGQLISLEFSDFLPPEVLAILRQLHDSSTFMGFDQVRYILGRELGPDKLSALEELTPEPIAAASIGQVHRAKVNGEPVVVKVQFPGISKSIDSDLAVLRRVANLWLQVQGRTVGLDGFFAVLTENLKREVDYEIEAENARRYRDSLNKPYFVVPKIYSEFSTKRVLTMSYEEGVRLADWLSAKPSPEVAQRFGYRLVELVMTELFANGFMQTDPNFGNFLFRPRDEAVILLDFGATQEISTELRQRLQRWVGLAVTGKVEDVLAEIRATGLVSDKESPEFDRRLATVITSLRSIWAPETQPFSYRDDAWLRNVRETTMALIMEAKHTPPPNELIFLNRKLSGMFHLLKDLEVVLNMTPWIDQMLATKIS